MQELLNYQLQLYVRELGFEAASQLFLVEWESLLWMISEYSVIPCSQ